MVAAARISLLEWPDEDCPDDHCMIGGGISTRGEHLARASDVEFDGSGVVVHGICVGGYTARVGCHAERIGTVGKLDGICRSDGRLACVIRVGTGHEVELGGVKGDLGRDGIDVVGAGDRVHLDLNRHDITDAACDTERWRCCDEAELNLRLNY